MTGDERIVHRPAPVLWWAAGGAFSVVVGFAFVAFAVDMSGWYKLAYVAFCALFPLAFVELALTHVALEWDRLTFVKNFRRRVIQRQEIGSVTWGKGVGVSLKLVDDAWVHLPEVGPSSQGLTNSIRAWLKRTAPTPGPTP